MSKEVALVEVELVEEKQENLPVIILSTCVFISPYLILLSSSGQLVYKEKNLRVEKDDEGVEGGSSVPA